MPDPQRLLTTLRRAREAFAATPGRQGYLVELQDADEVLVAGDLHGHLAHFAQILKRADLAQHPRRHLVLQELIHGPYLYDDGSDKSHQLLDLLAALKCQFPRQVHFLLGNHELSEMSGRRVGKGDDVCNQQFALGVNTAYGEHAEVIYAAYLEMMQAASLAVRTPNRIFMSHSLPAGQRLAAFDPGVLRKARLGEQDVVSGGSAHALVWGRDGREETVAEFLRQVDADVVITGHMPCEGGFDTPNAYQLILDSAEVPAAYCLFPVTRPLTLAELTACVQML